MPILAKTICLIYVDAALYSSRFPKFSGIDRKTHRYEYSYNSAIVLDYFQKILKIRKGISPCAPFLFTPK
jgi:hypothetical protein